MKTLGDCLNFMKLFVLPALKEVVPIVARRLFSGHDHIQENTVELTDLGYFKTCQSGSNHTEWHGLRTFINVHVWPDILSFANVDCFAQIDSKCDHTGDLLGLGVLETFHDEDVICKPQMVEGRTIQVLTYPA